jgi:hypothetical protein
LTLPFCPTPRWLTLLVAGGAMLLAANACNTVLGIEEAELDVAACPQEIIPSAAMCSPTAECEAELRQCEVGRCKQDAACRSALVAFHRCAPDDCGAANRCRGCFEGSADAACIGRHIDACRGAETLSLRQIYCACMVQNCKDTQEACEARELKEWRLPCLISHCELQPNDPSINHCAHATDANPQCPGAPEDLDPTCTKRQIGTACTDDDQCCDDLFCTAHHACGR